MSNTKSWKPDLQAGPACLSVEQLVEGNWTPDDRRHVETCARCQAELALFESFRADEPGEDQTEVQEITARLAVRGARPGRVIGRISPVLASPWLKIAAAVVIVAGLGYAIRDREPELRSTGSEAQVYRSGAVQLLAPHDDVPQAPEEFSWVAVAGAATYDIAVQEVDGAVLWTGSSATVVLAVPDSVTKQFAPGKTVNWKVTAKSAQGEVLATSPLQRFRVTPR